MAVTTFNYIRYNYIEGPDATDLNTVDIWLPENYEANGSKEGKWVIYIHGGAWRDPLVDSLSFEPTVDKLASLPGIAGFASINYRLSPHPHHPTHPSKPDDPSRNAKNPDHIYDVAKALEFLEILYGISSGYILIGHSCGATLAYQLTAQCGGATVPQPSTILGSEGIYNIPEMLKNHESPMYREFTVSAFGEDENVWKDVSPYYSKEPALWINCRTLIISHSEDDELVEKAQAYMMLEKFAKTSEFNGVVRYIPAFGNHDEIWGNPSEMARVIEAGLGMIQWPNANLTQSIEYI